VSRVRNKNNEKIKGSIRPENPAHVQSLGSM
jgi:hypothetical protein